MHHLTERPQRNVFGFVDPDRVECSIYSYQQNHRMLEIELHDPEPQTTVYLQFVMVHYFTGPTVWVGADFTLMPRLVSMEMAQTLEVFGNENLQALSRDELEEHLQLCKVYDVCPVNLPLEKITICAANVHVHIATT